MAVQLPLIYTVRPATPNEAPIIAHKRRAIFEATQDVWYLDIPSIDALFTDWLRPQLANGEYRGTV